MIREISFNNGIVDIEEKLIVCRIFPELESNFIRRKQYSEFYFEPKMVNFGIDQLEELTQFFFVTLSNTTVVIDIS